MLRLAIFISGRGSNMTAIINACKRGEIQAEVVNVISNKQDAKGLEIAKKNGLDTLALNPNSFENNEAYEKHILEILIKENIDIVCLAGYMKLLGPTILNRFNGRVINIHPSLLPSFKGLNAQKQALDYGVKFSGCTAHIVTNKLDDGPILLQEVVPVYDSDTEDLLSGRILKKEHIVYPKAINLLVHRILNEEKV